MTMNHHLKVIFALLLAVTASSFAYVTHHQARRAATTARSYYATTATSSTTLYQARGLMDNKEDNAGKPALQEFTNKKSGTQLSAATADLTTSKGLPPLVEAAADFSAATADMAEEFSSELSIATADMASAAEDLLSEEQAEYNRGLAVIGLVTFIFASNSPVIHAAFSEVSTTTPPVLLLNAAAAIVAFTGLVGFRKVLDGSEILEAPDSTLSEKNDATSIRAGFELGLAKTLGATANLYGLSMTSANHGAFIIQLTALIVPVVQGMMGIPIPPKIWTAVGLALSGVFVFTQAHGGGAADTASLMGDGLCACAALFYALYDLRLNVWGSQVTPVRLITNKIAFQALFSTLLLIGFASGDAFHYIQEAMASGWNKDLLLVAFVAIWNGFLVNAGASLIQVRAQNAIGPTRAQIVYSTQPVMAAILSYFFLHETVGPVGFVGGALFLSALVFATTAEKDDIEAIEEQAEETQ